MSKKINELTALTDSQVSDDSRLVAIGVAANGLLNRATIGQMKTALSAFKYKHVATGSEGTTITIGALAGKEILSIAREGAVIYEVNASPDNVEFIWNGTSITLGLATSAGERFLILYKTP